jgi:hypothetical protein
VQLALTLIQADQVSEARAAIRMPVELDDRPREAGWEDQNKDNEPEADEAYAEYPETHLEHSPEAAAYRKAAMNRQNEDDLPVPAGEGNETEQYSPRMANGAAHSGSERRDEVDGLVENIAVVSLQGAAAAAAQDFLQPGTIGALEPNRQSEDADGREAIGDFASSTWDTPRRGTPRPDDTGSPRAAWEEAQFESAADLVDDPQIAEEIRTWEKALRNKSPLIRKQAARKLKQLTGRDYEH